MSRVLVGALEVLFIDVGWIGLFDVWTWDWWSGVRAWRSINVGDIVTVPGVATNLDLINSLNSCVSWV